MDSKDFRFMLDLVDRRIERSTPTTAEYWRGYCQGLKEYFHQAEDDSARYRFEAIDDDRREPYVEAYARGYCDGLKGKMS